MEREREREREQDVDTPRELFGEEAKRSSLELLGEAGADGDESGRFIGGPSECEHGHPATAFHIKPSSVSGPGPHIQLPAADVVEAHARVIMVMMAMA